MGPADRAMAVGQLVELGNEFFAAQCVAAVCRLGVPTALGDGTLSAAELSAMLPGEKKVDAAQLERVLRMAAFKKASRPVLSI